MKLASSDARSATRPAVSDGSPTRPRPNAAPSSRIDRDHGVEALDRGLRHRRPPLSTAIGKLERKLGVVLLERTSRRVTLTPAGAVLLGQGRLALETIGAAVERARRAGAQPDRLVIAVKADGTSDLVQRITRRYLREPGFPPPDVVFARYGGPAAALRNGSADVAVLRTPFDGRGVDSERLVVEPRVAVLPADHPLAGRRRLRRADLAGEPMPRWAGEGDGPTAAYWAGTDTVTGGWTPPAAVADDASGDAAGRRDGPEINDISQLFDAVALGGAVAYVPVSLADRHPRSDLAFRPVSDLSPSEVMVAWPETSRSRAVAAFVRAAMDVAAEQRPAWPPLQAASRVVIEHTPIRSTGG
jgi:DNA-binding transcriptional LysR family regulator